MSPAQFEPDYDKFFDPNQMLEVRLVSCASSPSLPTPGSPAPGTSGLNQPAGSQAPGPSGLNQPTAEAQAEFPQAMSLNDPPRPPKGMPWGTFKEPLQEVTLTGAESLLPNSISPLGARLIYDAFRMNPSVNEETITLEVAHDAYINNDLPGKILFCNLPKLFDHIQWVLI